MRRLAIAWVAVTGVLGAYSKPASAADPCRVAHARLVLHNSQARVWDAGDTVYACLLGRRPLELGIRTSDDSSGADVLDVRRLRLAGRYVAWEDQCNCPSNPTNTIFVKDLRTRRNLVATATLTSSRPGPTDDLELTSSGAVAWIASDIFTNATRREVHKGDAAGAAELDSGNRIGRRLTREGSTIRWTNAGIARTARLRSQ